MYETALSRRGCIPMNFTGKSMRGFVFVDPEGTRLKKDLNTWLELALEFNPRAKMRFAYATHRCATTGLLNKSHELRLECLSEPLS